MRGIPIIALALLLWTAPAWAAEDTAAEDKDTDGDGLSDFREVHKYGTDPKKKDSDGDGKPDGDWDERREYAYSIRTIVRLMPPYNKKHLTDDYQDARIRAETDEYLEIEVIHYPLNTVARGMAARKAWLADTLKMPATYRAAGVTTNFDKAMQVRVLAELKTKGIDARTMTDKAYAAAVSKWLVQRAKGLDMFCTYYVGFQDGKPFVLPECARKFDSEIRSRGWSEKKQFEHELFGRSMFEHKTRGTCTSSAVYLTTALRAALLPTRMIVMIPPIDASDQKQVAMFEQGITHHAVRDTIREGVHPGSTKFTAHTLNEVWVGGRWHRLNYEALGDNILNARYMGLMTHIHTFSDLSEADFAKTWGVRFAQGSRTKAFPFSNPYRTLEVSDLFGAHSKVPNPKPVHTRLTIARAYWEQDSATPPRLMARLKAGQFGRGRYQAIFWAHAQEHFPQIGYQQYKAFLSHVDPEVLLKAKGHADVKAQATGWYFTAGGTDRELQFGISLREFAKLKRGAAYTLHPANGTPSHQWRIGKGVTVKAPR